MDREPVREVTQSETQLSTNIREENRKKTFMTLDLTPKAYTTPKMK